MNEVWIRAWGIGTLVCIVMVVIMWIRSASPVKGLLLVGGVLCSVFWPLLLPTGFVWGIVAGIRKNREDVVNAREAAIARKAIFDQYPQFRDE